MEPFYFCMAEDEEGMINAVFVSKAYFDAWACIESDHLADRLSLGDDWDEVAEAMFQYLGDEKIEDMRPAFEANGFIWNEGIING